MQKPLQSHYILLEAELSSSNGLRIVHIIDLNKKPIITLVIIWI